MAKAIMIQGTMSNAGKSLIVAGLCRILKQDGYKVAPFKSQNMALNSYITKEGLEMGRAQVVQAEAAGVEPIVAMNPILLKPTTDVGAQVIVNGISIGNMLAKEYFHYKKQLLPEIKNAYDILCQEYDIIVIEGAGSPAEINLKQEDIVNMGMAELADADVLLVGDIDRGGVFAQLYGTVMLLEPNERKRIKGLIINKFRGDKSILDTGVLMIEELCQIPVVGVTPYMQVEIEEEDSLGDQICRKAGNDLIDIAVIRLPRISNFTDFQVFSGIAHVSLRYVESVKELGNPDLIILPGSKNTIQDLFWLRQSGLEPVVLKMAAMEIPVLGICGGYQMLGQTIYDEMGVEGKPSMKPVKGLGLLPVETCYGAEKTRTRVAGSFAKVSGIFSELSGQPVTGYEIHMGQTKRIDGEDASHFCCLREEDSQLNEGILDGCCSNHIYGTYIHGILDQEGIAQSIVSSLLQKKGYQWAEVQDFNYAAYKEKQYDMLAEQLRAHLNMELIYGIIEDDRK